VNSDAPREVLRLVSVALWACGCAGTLAPAFDNRFLDNSPARTAAIAARLANPAAASAASAPLLCATTHGAKPELVAYDLARASVRWRVALRAESRPELLADLVVTTAGGRLLAFDAASGTPRLNVPLGTCTYLGAAREGDRIFYTCETSGKQPLAPPSARVTAIDARSGRVLWQREAAGKLGQPAASAGLVLLPWQWQSLAVLDARDGKELARLRSRDDVIDWVRADDRGVFFGQRTLYRFGRHGYAGQREASSHLRVASQDLPGRPPLMESAFAQKPGARSARGRIALYLEPEAHGNDGVGIAHDRYYLAFYRYVFAYDASGALRWAHMLAHDVLAGQVLPSGVAIVSDDGRMLVLGQDDGATLLQLAVGSDLAAASLSATGLVLAAPALAPAPTLRRSLTEIALDSDARLLPARAYAVAQLARRDEPEVTRDLLDVYVETSTPPELKRAIAHALRERRQGLEHMVDALAARYDFLEQSRAAPLAMLVPALVEAHESRAVPRLLERMLDHETPLAELPIVVRAVVDLGGDSVLEPLLSFVRLYRADSSFASQPQALLEAARGVLLHGGDQGPELLATIVRDGRASPALTSGIAGLSRTERSAEPTTEATVAAAAPSQALPMKLTQEAVNATFAEHIDDLRGCIIDELGRNPKLALLRIAFIAESDGSIHALHFAPNGKQLVACLYPKVAAYRFPAFGSGREVASYVVAVRADAERPVSAASNAAERHWWDGYAARARPEPTAPGTEPWWRTQQPLAALIDPIERADTSATPAAMAAPRPPTRIGATQPNATASPATTTQPTSAAPAQAQQVPAQAPEQDAWWMPSSPAQSSVPAAPRSATGAR
jgi:hypothetical protein